MCGEGNGGDVAETSRCKQVSALTGNGGMAIVTVNGKGDDSTVTWQRIARDSTVVACMCAVGGGGGMNNDSAVAGA